MDKPLRICTLATVLLLNTTQAQPYQEQVMQLHAPLAGMSPDGTAAYTQVTIVYGQATNDGVPVFEVYNSLNNKLERKQVGKGNFTDEEYNRFTSSSSEVDFYVANPAVTKRKFLSNPLLDYKFALEHERQDYYAWRMTSDYKYYYDGDGGILSIKDAKTEKDLLNINYYEIPSDVNYDSKMVINNEKSRLLLATKEGIKLYKINFKHLPKTSKDLDKQIVVDISGGDPKVPYQASNAMPDTLVISPDGKTAAAALTKNNISPYGDVWVRDMMTGKVKYMVKQKDVLKIAFSYDGKYLAITSNLPDPKNPDTVLSTYGLYLRDAKTGKILKKYFNVFSDPFFTRNGKLLYSDDKNKLHIITLPK